jgi:hypothetical protein
MGGEARRGQMDDEIMSDFSNCRFDTDKIPSVLGSVYSISTDCPLPSASGATPVRRSPENPPHPSFSTPNGSFYVTVPVDSLHPSQLNSMAGPPQPTGDCRFVTIPATLADASVRKESDGITCTTFDIFREPALYAVLLHWTESLPVPVSIVSSPQGAEKGGFIHQRHFLPVVEGGTSVPDRAP